MQEPAYGPISNYMAARWRKSLLDHVSDGLHGWCCLGSFQCQSIHFSFLTISMGQIAKLQSTTLPNQSPLFHLGFVRLFGEENSTQARANTRWNGGELTKPTSHVFLVKWRSFTNTSMACDSQDSPRSPKIHQANKNAYGFLYVPCTWLPGSTNLFQHDIYHPQKGYKSTTLPFFCYGNWPFPSFNKDCNINLLAVSAHLAKAQIASRLQAGVWLWASLRNWRQALFGAIRKP